MLSYSGDGRSAKVETRLGVLWIMDHVYMLIFSRVHDELRRVCRILLREQGEGIRRQCQHSPGSVQLRHIRVELDATQASADTRVRV